HGNAEVFAITADGRVLEQTQPSLSIPIVGLNFALPYSNNNWKLVGIGTKSIAAGRDVNGNGEIFAVTVDGRILEQTELINDGGYEAGSWSTIGFGAKSVAVGKDVHGNPEVFAATTDGRILEQTGRPVSLVGFKFTLPFSANNWSTIGFGATSM